MSFYLRLLRVLMLSCICFGASAQLPTINPFVYKSDRTTAVAVFDIRQPGTYYYDFNWNMGHIQLKSGDSLVGYYIRYDLIRNHLELLWDERKVGIYGTNIAGFSWFEPGSRQVKTFVSRSEFELPEKSETASFLEILEDGSVKLMKSKTVISRYQATSPSLVQDAYSSDVNTLSNYFLAKGDAVFEVSGRKKTLSFLGSEKLEGYIKENNLNFRTEEDLERIIKFYNSDCINE